jgi:hypothetical protein
MPTERSTECPQNGMSTDVHRCPQNVHRIWDDLACPYLGCPQQSAGAQRWQGGGDSAAAGGRTWKGGRTCRSRDLLWCSRQVLRCLPLLLRRLLCSCVAPGSLPLQQSGKGRMPEVGNQQASRACAQLGTAWLTAWLMAAWLTAWLTAWMTAWLTRSHSLDQR